MANGVLITLEGTEGAGKTTQLALLGDWLGGLGLPVLATKEPGAGRIGAQIRQVLLAPENAGLNPTAEALLMAADRAQHVAECLRPGVEAGQIVLCDRYIDSHIAYQGYGRGLDVAWLTELNRRATGDFWPDLTLFLELKPETGLARAKARGAADRMELEQLAFHQRIYDGFVQIATAEPGRVQRINADADVDTVQAQIRQAVWALLLQRGLVQNALR